MAEVLLRYEAVIADDDGRRYTARACVRQEDDGPRWEGWIEFVSDEGDVLRTRRETVQPNRQDLVYWATGLTAAYLEGALSRALEPWRPAPAPPPESPAYPGPAPEPTTARGTPTPAAAAPHPILDPFHVYASGEELLRKELGALDAGHLRTIVRAYGLLDDQEVDLQAMSRVGLAELIVAAVRKRVNAADEREER